MHKVKTETAPAVFLPKFQQQQKKTAHPYPTNFLKLIYITSQLSRSKYRISVIGPTLWNKFLSESEKEIENHSLYKIKVKSKLLPYENAIIFF